MTRCRTLKQQPSQLHQQVSPTSEGNEVKESSPVGLAHGPFWVETRYRLSSHDKDSWELVWSRMRAQTAAQK